MQHDEKQLENILNQSGKYVVTFSDEQDFGAYHISRKGPHNEQVRDGFLSTIRVYVPGGLMGVQLTREIVAAGADFEGAKIWLPATVEEKERFRKDTPIFMARTAHQLHSIITALRSLYASEASLWDVNQIPPVGLTVDGLPGVYIGQTPRGESFNNMMGKIFTEPIRNACNATGLKAGEIVTDEWLRSTAQTARELARKEAVNYGYSPTCHALLADQDPAQVFDAIAA